MNTAHQKETQKAWNARNREKRNEQARRRNSKCLPGLAAKARARHREAYNEAPREARKASDKAYRKHTVKSGKPPTQTVAHGLRGTVARIQGQTSGD